MDFGSKGGKGVDDYFFHGFGHNKTILVFKAGRFNDLDLALVHVDHLRWTESS